MQAGNKKRRCKAGEEGSTPGLLCKEKSLNNLHKSKRIIAGLVSLFLMLVYPVSLQAAGQGALQTPPGVAEENLEAFVDEYVSDYIGVTTAGASVLVLQNGEIKLNKAYGYANIEDGIPMGQEAFYEWGSITKLLTWVSVMQLAEQGLLQLDADIRTYLPKDFLTKLQYDEPVTLYHLMHHNAGWEDHLTDLFLANKEDIRSLEETLRITQPVQVHKPGTVVAYSNYGTALAGYIVERVSGQPYYTYVSENIFNVLGMSKTSAHPTQEDNPEVLRGRSQIYGYTLSAGGSLVVASHERIYMGLYPAGSVIGTIEDAAKFAAALLPEEGTTSPLFASAGTLEELLALSYSAAADFPGIAHGFWEEYYAVKTLGHGGNTSAFSSSLKVAADARLAVIVFTNQANEKALCHGLTNALLGKYAPPQQTDPMPSAYQLEGRYITARRPHYGFTKLYGLLQTYKVTAINDQQIRVFDDTFTQISPYVFCSEDNTLLYFDVQDGKVQRIAMLYADLLPLASMEWVAFLAGIAAMAACALYMLAASVAIPIGWLRNRKSAVRVPLAGRFNWGLNLAGVAAVANTLVLFVRALSYLPYSALKVHFLINIAFAVFALFCAVFTVVAVKKSVLVARQKIWYTVSCVAALLLLACMAVFQLYR